MLPASPSSSSEVFSSARRTIVICGSIFDRSSSAACVEFKRFPRRSKSCIPNSSSSPETIRDNWERWRFSMSATRVIDPSSMILNKSSHRPRWNAFDWPVIIFNPCFGGRQTALRFSSLPKIVRSPCKLSTKEMLSFAICAKFSQKTVRLLFWAMKSWLRAGSCFVMFNTHSILNLKAFKYSTKTRVWFHSNWKLL